MIPPVWPGAQRASSGSISQIAETPFQHKVNSKMMIKKDYPYRGVGIVNQAAVTQMMITAATTEPLQLVVIHLHGLLSGGWLTCRTLSCRSNRPEH